MDAVIIVTQHPFLFRAPSLKRRPLLYSESSQLAPILRGDIWLCHTLQEINISHLGKRKIIFKYTLKGGYVNSLEGKVFVYPFVTSAFMLIFGWSTRSTHEIQKADLSLTHSPAPRVGSVEWNPPSNDIESSAPNLNIQTTGVVK